MILIPPYIMIAAFSVYLAHGFEMSAADTFAVIMTINLLRWPMIRVPQFISEFA